MKNKLSLEFKSHYFSQLKIFLYFPSGGPKGATEVNIDEYMEKLHNLVMEGKNNAAVKQAREILNRIELPMN